MRRFLTNTFFKYSQPPPKNVFVMPKKYLIRPVALAQVYEATQTSYSCKMLAYLLRDNINFIHDEALGKIYHQLSRYSLEITEQFDTIIVPITLEYLKLYNRGNSYSLYQIALAAANLKIQNEVLWNAILNKLDGQNIYRYISLLDTARLLQAFVKHGKYINHPIMNKLQNVVYQQQNYYKNYPALITMISSSLKKLNQLSPKEEQKKIAEAYRQLV